MKKSVFSVWNKAATYAATPYHHPYDGGFQCLRFKITLLKLLVSLKWDLFMFYIFLFLNMLKFVLFPLLPVCLLAVVSQWWCSDSSALSELPAPGPSSSSSHSETKGPEQTSHSGSTQIFTWSPSWLSHWWSLFHLLFQEVTEKSERITQLEQEKSALIKQLFEARARSAHDASTMDSTFIWLASKSSSETIHCAASASVLVWGRAGRFLFTWLNFNGSNAPF